jgi:hypothetical protein
MMRLVEVPVAVVQGWERYLVRMRVTSSVRRASMEVSSSSFSRPEYWWRGLVGGVSRDRKIERAYAGGDLFAALIVEFSIGLAEDVVTLVLNAAGLEVPIRSLVARFGVDMGPDVRVGRDE